MVKLNLEKLGSRMTSKSQKGLQGLCNTREKNNISAKDILGKYEWKQQKSWMDEEFSRTVGQRKHAKLLWLQDTDQINADNLKNARCETSRHIRKKKREYIKGKINEHETNTKNRNIRHSNRR
jgi:hypothetical protein